MGTTGNDENCQEQAVKYFINKNIAEKYLQICKNYAKTPPIDKDGDIYYTNRWIDNSPNPFFTITYTRTDYFIIQRELIIDDFIKELLELKVN